MRAAAEHGKASPQRERLHVVLDVSKLTRERNVLLLSCLQKNLQSRATIEDEQVFCVQVLIKYLKLNSPLLSR